MGGDTEGSKPPNCGCNLTFGALITHNLRSHHLGPQGQAPHRQRSAGGPAAVTRRGPLGPASGRPAKDRGPALMLAPSSESKSNDPQNGPK